MKRVFISGIILAIWVLALSRDIPVGENFLPAIGRFFNPFEGIMQNTDDDFSQAKLNGPVGSDIEILFDERDVPHIYAQSLEDAIYAQGYLHAANRLFQMDISTRAAAGKLSELVGARALSHDHQQRERGIEKIAELKAESWKTENETLINAYVSGVNAYVQSLAYHEWPIEYKILSHAPVEWTPVHSALMATNMAIMLCMAERDLEYSNAKALLPPKEFAFLFPERNLLESPIIPSEKKWEFTPLPFSKMHKGTHAPAHADTISDKNADLNGSNNWAISPSRTKNGVALLANDPHLSLTLPSIWYELEIHTPEMHVHGASIPGIPFVIIGFNEHIAWGTTNSGQDVLDWYKITWHDSSRHNYILDDKTLPANLRIEEIKVRGGKSIIDTVRYTKWGPVTSKGDHKDMAMKWIGHEKAAANDFTFLQIMNTAKNVVDYRRSIAAYQYPAQNKVFASTSGDIAMSVAGVMPLRSAETGSFIADGSNSANDWEGFIPFDHAPFIINPKIGYVSSANQSPVDTSYSYPVMGTRIFEDYRGRVINMILDTIDRASVNDMKALQQNDYNLHAAEMLPLLISELKGAECLNNEERTYLTVLESWNYYHHRDSISPVYYELWYDEFEKMTFDELDSLKIMHPEDWRIIEMVREKDKHEYFDIKSTTEKNETLQDIACASFSSMVKNFLALDQFQRRNWGSYKATEIPHLARLGPFGVPFLHTSGSKHIVNAMGKSHGPSWRMIVEMTTPPKAYVNYPGGQSGNPASQHYTDMLEHFFEGMYYEVQLKNDPAQWQPTRKITITPDAK